ncbi:hypothetical protein AAG570_000312 [Ranatra chinensis]|uniref:Mitochondrial carrier protein n=1 Tax=Ranatra chinensis TaxID=642074 RepID=A0ABD0YX06_9HEMI
MVHNVSIVTAVQQLSSEGILRLYRGVLPPLCQKSLSISIMFGVYDKCHRPLAEHGVQPVLAKATAGIAAGTLEATLVPFERVQTLLQHERYHKVLENMKHTMYLLWERQGLREYYRGLTPVLLRNGPSNACFFILRDEAKSRLPDPDNIVGRTLNQFVIGAFIGALCSTMFYPCNVVKVHMQSRIGGPFQSFPSAVLEIYHDRGSSVRGFFRGVHLNYTRSCISWGVINVAYEGLKRVLERHIA